MLPRDLALLDSFSGGEGPSTDFGAALPDKQGESAFEEVAAQARARFQEVFGHDPSAASDLETTISEMWREGWSPGDGELDLFVRDFGTLLVSMLRTLAPSRIVLRSQTDLSHASLWFPQHAFEVFPFHKVYKRLTRRDGESLSYFHSALAERLRPH